MERYQNLGGDSAVIAYKIGQDYIVVQFKSGKNTFYNYTVTSAEDYVIKQMCSLARQGQGLNSYISTNQPSYQSRGNSLSEVTQ